MRGGVAHALRVKRQRYGSKSGAICPDRCGVALLVRTPQMDERELDEDDIVFERDGARVVIDDVSAVEQTGWLWRLCCNILASTFSTSLTRGCGNLAHHNKVSMEFMKGATIDFEVELIRSSFAVVNNPNVESGCGCGVSFAPKG